MSTIKVDNLDTRTGTGNITLNRPLVGDGSGLTNLPSQTANDFTNTLKTKLDNVEANATADQTKTDIEALGIDVPAANITGTHTSFTSTGIDDNANALAITIDSTESVGIGTATPSTRCEIMGNGAGSESLRISNSGDTANVQLFSGEFRVNNNHCTLGTTAALNLILKTSNAERMRITSAGRVGIGTTAPVKPLHVMETSAGAETVPLVLTNYSSTAGTAVSLGFGAIGSTDHYSKIQSQRNGSGDWDFSLWNANASGTLTERLTISKNGNIFSDSTTWAWAHFHGQLATIQKSSNVSSLTDVGTGTWRLNYTINALDNNHGTVGNGQDGTGNSATQYAVGAGPFNAGAIAVTARTIGGTLTDVSYLCAVSYSA